MKASTPPACAQAPCVPPQVHLCKLDFQAVNRSPPAPRTNMSETDVFALDEQEEPCFAPQPSAAPACFTPRIKQSSGSSNACRGAQSDGTPERAAEERQGPASDAAEEQDAGAASSSSGSSSGTAVGVECGTPPPEPNDGIEVARRVVPLLEYSEDICSVCLDEYTSQDPGAPTVCG